MTQSPEHHDAATSAADPELEQLLCDAYDAPPVPASLYTRIEQAVEQEWGKPIRPTTRRAADGAGTLGRSARWARTRLVPIAACLLVAVAVGFVLNANSRVYAWSTVVEALAPRRGGPAGRPGWFPLAGRLGRTAFTGNTRRLLPGRYPSADRPRASQRDIDGPAATGSTG